MAELRATIAELEAILADDGKLRGVIKDEMGEIREKFATPRRSEITFDVGDLDIEDLIDDEDLVVTMTAKGYVKTVAADAFRTQGRGGRGVAGAKLRDEDWVNHIIHTSAHAYLLFFSNLGPRLPAQGPRDPDEGAHGPRHRHRQPAAAAAGRDDPGHHRHPRLRDQPLPVLRHPQRAGQEDQVHRVRLVAAGRPHRHQPARRRRAGQGHPHQRGRRHLHGQPRRHDHPVQRGRGPRHGPGRGRRAGHEAQGRRPGRLLRRRPRRRRRS